MGASKLRPEGLKYLKIWLAPRVQGFRAEFFGISEFSEFGSSEILDSGFLGWRFGGFAFRTGCNSGLSTRMCGSEFCQGRRAFYYPGNPKPDPHLEDSPSSHRSKVLGCLVLYRYLASPDWANTGTSSALQINSFKSF